MRVRRQHQLATHISAGGCFKNFSSRTLPRVLEDPQGLPRVPKNFGGDPRIPMEVQGYPRLLKDSASNGNLATPLSRRTAVKIPFTYLILLLASACILLSFCPRLFRFYVSFRSIKCLVRDFIVLFPSISHSMMKCTVEASVLHDEHWRYVSLAESSSFADFEQAIISNERRETFWKRLSLLSIKEDHWSTTGRLVQKLDLVSNELNPNRISYPEWETKMKTGTITFQRWLKWIVRLDVLGNIHDSRSTILGSRVKRLMPRVKMV